MLYYYFRQGLNWIPVILFGIGLLAVLKMTVLRDGPSARDQRDFAVVQRQHELAENRAETVADNLDDAVALIDESKVNFQATLAQIDLWQMEIEPLPKNAEGQLIAQHDELVDDIAYLFHQDRPTRGEVLSKSAQTEEAEDKLTTGVMVDGPSGHDLAEIRELHQFSVESKLQWENAVTFAQALVRASKRPPPAEDRTSALAENTEALPLQEQMEIARDKMIMARLGDWRELEEERQQALFDAKTEKLLDEQKKAEEQRQLIEEAHSAEVKSALSVFLQERLVQPRLSGAAVRMRRISTRQPMSLAALESTGALRPTETGLKMLARLATDRDLPEPRWHFGSEPGSWSDENHELLTETQALLIRLGPTLVNEGLLSP